MTASAPKSYAQAVRVLDRLIAGEGLDAAYQYAPIGGAGYDRIRRALSRNSPKSFCHQADAVLLGAVGSPRYDNLDTRPLRPEHGLLAIRKDLNLFANLRPAILYKELANASTRSSPKWWPASISSVRELTGDIYFGEPPRHTARSKTASTKASTPCATARAKSAASAHVAFQATQKRNEKSVLRRQGQCAWKPPNCGAKFSMKSLPEYPDVELSHMYVDDAAMQLAARAQTV